MLPIQLGIVQSILNFHAKEDERLFEEPLLEEEKIFQFIPRVIDAGCVKAEAAPAKNRFSNHVRYISRQLQNSGPSQNRPFELFCDPAASPTPLSMISAAGFGPPCGPQNGSKSSVFPGSLVLQLPLLT